MPLRRQPTPVPHRAWAVLTRHPSQATAERDDSGTAFDLTPFVAPRPSVPDRPPSVSEQVTATPGGRHRPRSPAPRWLVVPTPLTDARRAVSSRALVGVLLVILVVALVLGVRVAWAESGAARPAPTPSLQLRSLPNSSPPGQSASAPPTTARPSPAAMSELVVHVVGQVAHPGVVRLPAGSRVADALTAAGGALPGADLARVNLARLVVDGEQVVVPAPGEALPSTSAGGGGSGGGGPGGGGSGNGGAPAGATGGLVDLNTAELAALDGLPGVGPVLAGRILDWRAAHGRFTSVDELGEVSGIGERLLEQLRPLVTV